MAGMNVAHVEHIMNVAKQRVSQSHGKPAERGNRTTMEHLFLYMNNERSLIVVLMAVVLQDFRYAKLARMHAEPIDHSS